MTLQAFIRDVASRCEEDYLICKDSESYSFHHPKIPEGMLETAHTEVTTRFVRCLSRLTDAEIDSLIEGTKEEHKEFIELFCKAKNTALICFDIPEKAKVSVLNESHHMSAFRRTRALSIPDDTRAFHSTVTAHPCVDIVALEIKHEGLHVRPDINSLPTYAVKALRSKGEITGTVGFQNVVLCAPRDLSGPTLEAMRRVRIVEEDRFATLDAPGSAKQREIVTSEIVDLESHRTLRRSERSFHEGVCGFLLESLRDAAPECTSADVEEEA